MREPLTRRKLIERGAAAGALVALGQLRSVPTALGALSARRVVRRLALGASGIAVGMIGAIGKRGTRRGTRQENRDEELTHDSDLSSSLQRKMLLFR